MRVFVLLLRGSSSLTLEVELDVSQCRNRCQHSLNLAAWKDGRARQVSCIAAPPIGQIFQTSACAIIYILLPLSLDIHGLVVIHCF